MIGQKKLNISKLVEDLKNKGFKIILSNYVF